MLPASAVKVRDVVRVWHGRQVPRVACGSGSGVSGGALAIENRVLLVPSRMRRTLDVDLDSQRFVVEPGVTNIAVSHAVAPDFFYPPEGRCRRARSRFTSSHHLRLRRFPSINAALRRL